MLTEENSQLRKQRSTPRKRQKTAPSPSSAVAAFGPGAVAASSTVQEMVIEDQKKQLESLQKHNEELLNFQIRAKQKAINFGGGPTSSIDWVGLTFYFQWHDESYRKVQRAKVHQSPFAIDVLHGMARCEFCKSSSFV